MQLEFGFDSQPTLTPGISAAVARLIWVQKVAGSNPASPITYLNTWINKHTITGKK